MKAIYLNVEDGKAPKVVDIEDNLNVFYKMLNCKTIDIVTRKIGNNYYDIICDDNGIFKDVPITSAIDNKNKSALVGNLLVVGLPNDDGDLQGLTDEQTFKILKNTHLIFQIGTDCITRHYVLKLNM